MFKVYWMNAFRGCWEYCGEFTDREEAQAEAKRGTIGKVLESDQVMDPTSYSQVRNVIDPS